MLSEKSTLTLSGALIVIGAESTLQPEQKKSMKTPSEPERTPVGLLTFVTQLLLGRGSHSGGERYLHMITNDRFHQDEGVEIHSDVITTRSVAEQCHTVVVRTQHG